LSLCWRPPGPGEDYGIALEPTLEALLVRQDIDVVVVTTPPDGHADQVVAAAAGKHVLVEKPMAVTVAESRRMVEAADRARRDSPSCRSTAGGRPVAARRLLAEGRVGTIRCWVQSTAVGWWDMKAREDEWKKDPAKQTALLGCCPWLRHLALVRRQRGRARIRRTTYSLRSRARAT
jgi:predicted dehydrogenase